MSDVLMPENWLSLSIEAISDDVTYGYTASSTSNNTGYKLLRITDIQDDSVNWADVPFCEISENDLKKYTLANGDLVFARTGATVGKSYLIRNLKEVSVYASYLIRIRFNSILNPSYFSYFFKSADYWSQISSSSAGIGQPNVNGTKLKQLNVPIAPLAEQQEIVRQLDVMLAQVEQIKARLDAIPAILKKFRQSVLADAVSGRLVDENYIELVPLIHCVTILNGARKPVSQTERQKLKGEIPYYGATGVVDHLNGYTHEGPILLVGEDGANLLTKTKDLAYIVNGKCWVNNHAHVLKQKEEWNLEFIKFVINSMDLSEVVTGSAQPKLTKKALQDLPLPKFDKTVQDQIVTRVNQIYILIETLEKKVCVAQKRVNLLTQSILAKAFSGELTAEWREQHQELITGVNSAESLLAKIQAEREASKLVKKTRVKKEA